MKELPPNVKKCLESLLQTAEWTAHPADRRDKELQYLKYANEYRRKGYDTGLLFDKYDQYIVNVNKRKV